jgi:UDP-N-acetylglucosamine diphosphorylase/glucosamine-1-phosphate N-acetyltransferase
MNLVLFDDNDRENLLPFTYTRPVADIRVGILTIREKWELYYGKKTFSLTEDYLTPVFPSSLNGPDIFVNGSVLPSGDLKSEIDSLQEGEALSKNGILIAIRPETKIGKRMDLLSEFIRVEHPWDIFSKNGTAIRNDFEMLVSGRTSAEISPTVKVLGDEIFVEEGATLECCILNSTTGPIYIGKGAEVMEGSIIRGPFALLDHASTKLGTKIYGPTTIGPHSKVGGEINNSVIFGYSNKAHDGFLGNSVLGEWCNLGADTNNSNLKNNYSNVKVWSPSRKTMIDTGLQFCGLFMGDHSRCGINTMFNTGTMVGVSCNIYGAGFPEKFIPSFSWGGEGNFTTYKLEEAMKTAERVYQRRGKRLEPVEADIMKTVFSLTAGSRDV